DLAYQLQAPIAGAMPAGPEADAALLGELERVAQQIDQYLAQSGGVADDHRCLGSALDIQGQLQSPLAGGIVEGLGSAQQQAPQFEADVLELEGVALDAGQVEDIVDDLQQMIGGFTGNADVLALFAAEFGSVQQLQHPHDAIERSAQL